MVFNIPFDVLVLYMAIATVIFLVGLIMGLRRIVGSPFICVFAGLMMFALIVLIDNIEVDYVESIDYTLSYPMNQTARTASLTTSTTIFGVAERVVNTNSLLLDKEISCVRMNLFRTGSPTGNAIIGVFDEDLMVIKQIGIINASTLNTLSRNYEVCLPNHDYYQLSLYDRVGIKYTGSTVGNTISIGIASANPFDGTNSVRSLYSSGAWADTTTDDLTMVLIFDDTNISGEPVLHQFNDNDIFPFTIVLTVFYIFVGIIIQMQAWRKD